MKYRDEKLSIDDKSDELMKEHLRAASQRTGGLIYLEPGGDVSIFHLSELWVGLEKAWGDSGKYAMRVRTEAVVSCHASMHASSSTAFIFSGIVCTSALIWPMIVWVYVLDVRNELIENLFFMKGLMRRKL
jgi:hypothetical protein